MGRGEDPYIGSKQYGQGYMDAHQYPGLYPGLQLSRVVQLRLATGTDFEVYPPSEPRFGLSSGLE